MMKLESGAIVLVNFPFTDLQSSKVRPALVLTVKGEDVIIVGIFWKVPVNFRESWLKIDESNPAFGQTGLKKASIIKTEKIAVVHRSLIRKKLGYFSPELLRQVKQTLRKTLEMDWNFPKRFDMIMDYVSDTHSVVWYLSEDPRSKEFEPDSIIKSESQG
jgi:mRNA interferase MazF